MKPEKAPLGVPWAGKQEQPVLETGQWVLGPKGGRQGWGWGWGEAGPSLGVAPG